MLDWLENNKYLGKIIRFWLAGMCCYFVLWGSSAGKNSLIDAVFFLSLVVGCVEMFVATPLINFIEHGESNGPRLSVLQGVARRLKTFLQTLVVMIGIVLTYWLLNQLGQLLLGTGFNLAVEPIIFGLLYTGYFGFWKKSVQHIRKVA